MKDIFAPPQVSFIETLASYFIAHPPLEWGLVFLVVVAYLLDKAVDKHLTSTSNTLGFTIVPNTLATLERKLQFGLIFYWGLIIIVVLSFYNEFYELNGKVTVSDARTHSIERFPSLDFYKTMSSLFLGMFIWGMKIATDKIKSKQYISCLFVFFMGYCLFAGIVFLEAINHFHLILFNELAVRVYVEAILTNFILFIAALGVLYMVKAFKSIHFN
jgi:hypothetical protein